MTECACSKAETEVFQPLKVLVNMDEGRWYNYNPQNPINTDSLDFIVAGNNEEMIDMSNISLYLAGRIKLSTGANLPAAANVQAVNNFFGAMIKHVAVSVNKQLITPTISDYAYKDYIHKLINYDMPAQGTQQYCIGFHPDTPGESNQINRTANNVVHNPGAQPRKTLIKESGRFEVRGPLSVDLFETMRLLVPDADLNLKIFFNDAAFFLHSSDVNANYKLELEEATLFVRKVRVIPSLANDIDSKLATTPAIYPFIRREIVSYNIPIGFSTFKQENIFRGQLANRYFVFLVDAGAANGDKTKNPFELKHYNLTQVGLYENGQNIAGDPVEVNFDAAKSMNAYHQLLESIGALGERAS